MQRTIALIQKSIFLCALCLGAWLLQIVTSQAQTAQEKKALAEARSLHRSGGYPTHLPKGKPPPRPTRGCDGPRIIPSGWGQGCGSVAPWLLLGLVLVLLLSAVLPSLRRSGQGAPGPKTEEAGAYTPEVLGRTLRKDGKDATLEDFVRDQDWEGAICLLLYQAMQGLGWKHQGKGKSQTAREVVHQVPASAPRATPLYALLGLAERVRFGGVAATEALYNEAKASLHAFQEQPDLPPRQAPQDAPPHDARPAEQTATPAEPAATSPEKDAPASSDEASS